MYENLHFDAGAYELSCGNNGSFSNYFHPEQINELDLDIPETTRTGFYLAMQPEPNGPPFYAIPHSDNSKSYTVCFQKLINDMGIQDEKFIKLGMFEITDSGNKQLKQNISYTEKYKEYINETRFCKNKIFENFHFSLLCSEYIGIPMMIDSFHDKLIENTNKEIIKKVDMRLDIFNKINSFLNLKISDFSSLSIDEILDLRKDKSFKNFRKRMLNINEYLSNKDEEEEIKIESLFFKEIIEEVKEFAPSKKSIGINGTLLMLGFLPHIGNATSIAGYAKELKSYNDFQQSSIAFIMKYMD